MELCTIREHSARARSPAAEVVALKAPISTQSFFVLLVGCCFLHAALRALVSETAGIDDVDQVLRAQIWSWGYGPQPPLYTWLTKIFLGTFGYRVFSLLLLKETLVFCVYGLVYAAAHKITGSQIKALLAVALMEANFSISWEAHRELTHTVLASAVSMATLCSFLCLRTERWISYFWFGLCTALGMLSKYNFAFLWVSLVLAGAFMPQFRSRLLNRKMPAVLLLAALICLPHALWVLHHKELALSSVYKLKLLTRDQWRLVGGGLEKWGLAVLAHVGPMVAIIGIFFGAISLTRKPESPEQKFFLRTGWWILSLVAASIILFRVSGVKDRYAQPLLVWVPALLVIGVPESSSRIRINALLSLGLIAALSILLIAPGRVLLTDWLNKREVLNTPFRKLAPDIAPELARADCLLGADHVLAGNFRLWFPDKLVLDPEVGPLFSPAQHTCLLVWNADRSMSPPSDLLALAQRFGASKPRAIKVIEERLKYHRSKFIRLAVMPMENFVVTTAQ